MLHDDTVSSLQEEKALILKERFLFEVDKSLTPILILTLTLSLNSNALGGGEEPGGEATPRVRVRV